MAHKFISTKYHIVVSRKNQDALHIYTNTEEECKFIKELLNKKMVEDNTIIAVSSSSISRVKNMSVIQSIIWHLRHSVNNGNQEVTAGECEEYFKEMVNNYFN